LLFVIIKCIKRCDTGPHILTINFKRKYKFNLHPSFK
jgi:hypothetical protein